jgi:hypothetical protein
MTNHIPDAAEPNTWGSALNLKFDEANDAFNESTMDFDTTPAGFTLGLVLAGLSLAFVVSVGLGALRVLAQWAGWAA